MAHDFELVDHASARELKRTESYGGATKEPGRRLFRFGILTLGVLCIFQAVLNVSLRFAFHARDDTNQLPDGILSELNICQTNNSAQLCSCCNNLLRKLFKEYQKLKKEIENMETQLITETSPEDSGSGYLGYE